MRLAVIGSGIAGLTATYLLRDAAEVTLYEARDEPGGHTHTVDVSLDGGAWPVETGFVVFNPVNYPNLIRLFRRLGVAWQPSDMSFSVRSLRTGLEYCPSSPGKMFAQRRNLLRPRFWGMLRDAARFRRASAALLADGDEELTLGAYLDAGGYGEAFIEEFLVPMGAAIWSADPHRFREFPARYFVRFFENHRLLYPDQPKWRTVTGGARNYVGRIVEPLGERLRAGCPVRSVRRLEAGGVEVVSADGREQYDEVIVAAHSDQALAMLADPAPAEREILGGIPFQANDVVLHTDTSLLPVNRNVWASWNYLIPAEKRSRVSITYNMTRLQSLEAPETFCVSLNVSEAIDPDRVVSRMRYDHPVYSCASLGMRKRWGEISGVDRIHYCGAYWGYGFHEDGVKSALRVAARFGAAL